MDIPNKPCPTISASQLQELLLSDNPVIVDCRFDLMQPDAGYQAYLQGHIPGAYYAHLEQDLSGPVTPQHGRHPLPAVDDFMQTIRRWGIAPETTVVVYDDQSGLFASRLWWQLSRWLGFARIFLLDGGYKSWLREGGASTLETPENRPLTDIKPVNTMKRCYLDTDSILRNLSTEYYTLLDVRAYQRYAGIHEPIDPVAGHIPGAINMPLSENLQDNGLFKSPEDLRHVYRKILNTPEERLVLMCGSGVTACHSLLALELIGKSRALLYPGSWSEWIRNPAHPINTSGSPK